MMARFIKLFFNNFKGILEENVKVFYLTDNDIISSNTLFFFYKKN
jgi:hypothetical protein